MKNNTIIHCPSARYIMTVVRSTGSLPIEIITVLELWHIVILNRCMSLSLNQQPMAKKKKKKKHFLGQKNLERLQNTWTAYRTEFEI